MARTLTIDATGQALADTGERIGEATREGGLFVWRGALANITTDTAKAMAWELAGVFQCHVKWESEGIT